MAFLKATVWASESIVRGGLSVLDSAGDEGRMERAVKAVPVSASREVISLILVSQARQACYEPGGEYTLSILLSCCMRSARVKGSWTPPAG